MAMNIRLLIVAVCGAFALPLPDALAASQLLGVVASAEPISMTCAEGECTVELSAFCLERDRAMPIDGAPYRLLDPDKIALVVTAKDGGERRIAAAPYVQVASERDFHAVKVSVPQSVFQELGATRIAVAVSPQLILAPQTAANDPQPITDDEIDRARNSLRSVALSLFDPDSRELGRARIINRLINALPSQNGVDLATSDRIWGQVVGGEFELDRSDPVIAEVASIYSSCRLGATNPWPPTLRRCLQMNHDAIMGGINSQYWQAVDAGS
jgi:hypothetical protein